jgi:hypothetical protein
MEVQQVSTPDDVSADASAGQGDVQAAAPAAEPTTYDTSSDDSGSSSTPATLQSASDDATQVPPADSGNSNTAGLAPPASADDWQGVPADSGKPVNQQQAAINDPNQKPHADGSPVNVESAFKLDPSGHPYFVGSTPIAPHARDTSNDTTAWGAARNGFVDGITKPGQFFGKVADMANNDNSHSGENTGKKVDDVLKQVPIVGDGYKIGGLITGQKNDGGTIPTPFPSVKPDMEGGGKAPVGEPKGKPSEGGKGAGGEPEAPAPKTNEQGKAPPVKNEPSTKDTHFNVPDSYAIQPSGSLKADPAAPGILRDDNGVPYISSGNKLYRATFDNDNGTWRVMGDDPTKFQYPVKLDENGNWQSHGDTGLKGGAPGDDGAKGGAQGAGDNRDRLNNALQPSPTLNQPGSYPSTVEAVNNVLKHHGIGLSNQSAENIMDNIKKVNAGEKTNAGASASEAREFLRDAKDTSLPMKDRLAAGAGALVNTFAGPAYMAQTDIANYHLGKDQTADLRNAMHLYTQFDPHA